MTQLTNWTIMRFFLGTFFLVCGLFGSSASADELSRAWKLDKTVEYFGDKQSIPANKFDSAQIVNNVIMLPGCTAKLEKTPYSYSRTFQSLLKEHVGKEAFNNYACYDPHGKKRYQLLETGKFQKL